MGKYYTFIEMTKKKYIHQNRKNAFKNKKYPMFEHVNIRIIIFYSKNYI